MLHITNGDCAVAVLSQAVKGELLPWRDVLHEGPVHAGLPLEALSHWRASFIASAGWGELADVAGQFAERDAALASSMQHEEVVLWFEHDLYDQLQLLQLLDWFAAHPHPRLSLVCEAEYLGTMTPGRAADLFTRRRPVMAHQLLAGSAAWAAFGSPNPRCIRIDSVPGLPFLAAAFFRLLEEFPWRRGGLSRLERQVLEALRDAPLPFDTLFPRAHENREEPVFLGDAVLRWRLSGLASDGLLSGGETWRLTARGKDILDAKLDAWSFRRRPRWIGGYEIRDGRPRWDPVAMRLI